MISLDQVKREQRRRLLESNFLFFVFFVFFKIYKRKFMLNWHHRRICNILERVRNQELFHVVINIGPRYTKTELLVIWQAWCFAKQKTDIFLGLSYSAKLAAKNSLNVQSIILSNAFQELWPMKFSKSQRGKTLWSIEKGGEVFAGNTGGAVTGFGAGRPGAEWGGAMIIDDPQKVDDSWYETKRHHIKNNFDNTLVSRLNNPSITPIIIIMQRIHEDDLTGHVLSDNCIIDFDHFSYAALKEKGETSWGDKRRAGQALWPAKHTVKQLKKIEQRRPMYFVGQLQQRPAPIEGMLVRREWLRFYNVPPASFSRGIYVSVDMNAKDGEGAKTKDTSNACFSIYGVNPPDIYLLDQKVGKWPFGVAETILRKFIPKDYRAVLVEEFANGAAMMSQLRKHYRSVISIRPNTSKVFRLNEVIEIYSGGNIWYPSDMLKPWSKEHVVEILTFPQGKNDDRVDAETQMLKYFLLNISRVIVYDQ